MTMILIDRLFNKKEKVANGVCLTIPTDFDEIEEPRSIMEPNADDKDEEDDDDWDDDDDD